MDHNIEENANTAFNYGQGYLIKNSGDSSSGYASIMAYETTGFVQTNYYSNPDVTHPQAGTPTGVSGSANNVRVLTEQRFMMAAVGDESGSCGAGVVTTAAPPTTIAPATTTKKPTSGSVKFNLR